MIIQLNNNKFPGYEMVSLEDSKPLPVQPARGIGQDMFMGDGVNMSSNSDNQLANQDYVILNVSLRDNMSARHHQQQAMSPNQMIP